MHPPPVPLPPASTAGIAPGRLRSRQLIGVALLLSLLMGLAAAGFLVFELRDIRAQQTTRVELYARMLDDQAAAEISAADAVLRSLVEVVDRAPADERAQLTALLTGSLRGRPYLRSLSLLDAGGWVLASSNPANLGVQVAADRLVTPVAAYGSAQLAALAAGRDLDDLTALGQPPQAQAPALALPMVAAVDGRSGPIRLVALINPGHLADNFESLIKASPLQAMLLGFNGQLIVATGGIVMAPGASLASLPAFTQFLPMRESGSGIGPGADGQQVLSAFRTLRQWPLVLMVEQDQGVYWSTVGATGAWVLVILLTAWALVGAGTWTVRRSLLRAELLRRELDQSHQSTRASESRKLAVLQSALDAIVTADAGGRILDFNPAAERLFGHPADQAIGRAMHELIVPPGQLAAPLAGMAHPQAGGAVQLLNRRSAVQAIRADGSIFDAEMSVVPVRTEAGEIFTATLRDITDRQRAERALRDSEDQANATFEQAAVGMFQQSLDMRLLRVNQKLCDMLGYSSAEMLALRTDELVHQEDFAAAKQPFLALVRGEISHYAIDGRNRCKDGRHLWTRLTSSVVRDAQGRARYLVGVLEDISARHEAEAALRESEARANVAFEQAALGVYEVSLDGRLLRVNQKLCDMLGYTHAELLALPAVDILHPDEVAMVDARLTAALQGGSTASSNDRRYRRKDGSELLGRVTGSVARDGQGQATHLIRLIEDIGERRAAEVALRDSEARLEETGRIAGIGGWQYDVATDVFWSTDQSCRIHEIPPGSSGTLAKTLAYYAPAAQPAIWAAARECLASGKSFDLELPFITARGRPLWVRAVGRAEWLDGRVVRLLGALQDITKRHNADQQLVDARQRELQVGAQIQQSLLVTAPPPDVGGLLISSHSQASQGIDGDFVEIIGMGEHCVDIIAGDVMGKGLAAAMMGAATKLQFNRSIAELTTRAQIGDALPSPAAVVAAVHRAMTPALQALEAFVTLCYLRIDTRHDTVTWVGCGHEETLLLPAGAAPLALANQHPPLGVLDATDYVQDERPLRPGDALFLCSDGVTDALRPDGERVGRERINDAVARRTHRHATPAAVLHGLRRDLLQPGTRLQDDLTLVVVLREPLHASLGRIELPLDLQALRQVRGFVASHAAAAGLDQATAGLLEVAAVEIFTNIVRHGVDLLDAAPVELLARHTTQSLVFELVHLGAPFTPPEDPPPTDFADFPEGGFGLQIIHGATDAVEYLHVDGVNTIRMTKHLNAAPPAAPSEFAKL